MRLYFRRATQLQRSWWDARYLEELIATQVLDSNAAWDKSFASAHDRGSISSRWPIHGPETELVRSMWIPGYAEPGSSPFAHAEPTPVVL